MSFSRAPNTTYKEAKFPSVQLKKAYVLSECTDSLCKQAYYNHEASKTKEQRAVTAEALAATRYNHFVKWAKKNLPDRKFPPLKPIDDGGVTA